MSDVTVPEAAGLPPGERGQRLLSIPEDQWFDRKSIRIQPKRLAKDIAAFANAEGGVLVLGLSDGEVEGIDRSPKQVNAARQAAIDLTQPPVRVSARELSCVRSDDGQDDRLLVLEIPPSNDVHATSDDQVYLRVGDESRKLTFRQRQELLYDKGQAHFDSTPVTGVTLDELSQQLLGRFQERLRARDLQHMLKSLGLMTREGEVSAAAYLLFAETPQDVFTEAYVRILRFRGTERGSGVRQKLSDDTRCVGPIPLMIEEARSEIDRLQPAYRTLGRAGRFERRGLIPEDAWMEGLVNAVIHRSYSLGGDHIRVEIFDNRIEIHSPGRFPGLARPRQRDPLSIVRFARNPRIAKACSILAYGQELGEGIRRIFDEMRIAGLADPVYSEGEQGVTLTLQALQVDANVMARMPVEAREVLVSLQEAGGMSTGDLADSLGRSRPYVVRLLKSMREAGLIDWVGKSAQDPRAYWRIHVE